MQRRLTSKLVGMTTVLAILSGPAMAAKLKSTGGTAGVAIWIDYQAMKDADRLINSGVAAREPERVMPYLSCLTDTGTEVVVTGSHVFSGYFDVIIISGPYARKCAGVVKMDYVDPG